MIVNILCRWGGIASIVWLGLAALPGIAANHAPSEPGPNAAPQSVPPIRSRVDCPREIEPLTTALLRDLPQYINRLSHQRGGSQAGKYVIVASRQPELEPLPVTTSYPSPQQGGLHQIFFTVLERQYVTRSKIDSQNYYWLFLAHTPQFGWQLAILYTRNGAYPGTGEAPSPLRDATREVPGLAIRQWLRDCEAKSVPFPLTDDSSRTRN